MSTEVSVHLAYGQLALCCCVYSMSALINRHNMVDRTPENVVWCLGGTLLPSDTISTTWCLSCHPPWGFLQLFSRQDKLVRLCTFFNPSEWSGDRKHHGHYLSLCFWICACLAILNSILKSVTYVSLYSQPGDPRRGKHIVGIFIPSLISLSNLISTFFFWPAVADLAVVIL